MSAKDEKSDGFELVITGISFAAADIRQFELRHAGGEFLPAFTPGAHIGVRVPCGEMRNYSLCSDPFERDRYVIAVKREAQGRGGSISLIDQTALGDRLMVSPPQNDFALKPNRAGYIFIAGGIGITPILSMVRFLKSAGGPSFKLYYLARSREAAAFAGVLGAPEFRSQANIHFDDGDASKSFDLWPVLAEPKGAHLYCCGPRALMQSVRDMTGHWSPAALHFESFADASAMRKPDDHAFHVRLARSGADIEIPADASILDTLRKHGQTLPSSCESGTCGTCRTKLLAGEADHRDLVLSDSEKQNFIMICVSRARSDVLTLDL